MRSFLRLIPACVAVALLAAPVAGMCVSLVASDDPCAMQEAHEAASCGHAEMVMTGCCSVESVDPPAEGILPGPGGDIEPPALAGSLFAASASDGLAAAVLACDGDPPPAVPRYRLFSSLLL